MANENDKLADSQRRLQERMENYYEPQRRLQEQMERYLEPQRRLQEQMERYYEPQRRLQEQMERYLAPQRRLQERMENYYEPQRRLQEQTERYLAPQRRLQEQMERYLEPQRRLQEQMERYLAPQRWLQERMEKYYAPQLRLQERIEKYFLPLSNYLSEPGMENFAVNLNGLITVNNETVEVNEINETITSISNQLVVGANFLDQFFEVLGKLKSAVRIAVIYLILPYFLAIMANLTTPLYEEWWKNHFSSDKRIAKKELYLHATDLYDDHELNEYRFVNTRVLHVRKSGYAHSQMIGVLTFGKVVSLLEKSKNWSLIEYYDDDNYEIRHGWVFSRYLSTFKK